MDLKGKIEEFVKVLELDYNIVKSQETRDYIEACISDLNEILEEE